MKKKIAYLTICAVVIALVAGLMIYIDYYNKGLKQQSSTSAVSCSVETIESALTASGQITAGTTKTLAVSTKKKMKTACVEAGDTVSKGDPLCQYADSSYLTAPFDGVVTVINLPANGTYATSANYITVAATDTLAMSIDIDQADYTQIALGQTVTVIANGDETKTYQGTITYISGSAVSRGSSSVFTAQVEITNDGYLKVGMSAVARIILQQAQDAITVPIEAVGQDDEGLYVIVCDDSGSQTRTAVTIGLSDADNVEITSGLTGTEKVLVSTQ